MPICMIMQVLNNKNAKHIQDRRFIRLKSKMRDINMQKAAQQSAKWQRDVHTTLRDDSRLIVLLHPLCSEKSCSLFARHAGFSRIFTIKRRFQCIIFQLQTRQVLSQRHESLSENPAHSIDGGKCIRYTLTSIK